MKLELWAEMQRIRRKSVKIEVIEPGPDALEPPRE
jgi:hypothetical protein